MGRDQLQPPRGTRDFFPEQMRIRSWLFDHFRSVAHGFGFDEIDAPMLEYEELFTRKAGEEIVEQLFRFELHGRRYALRPELTPSAARMVMARHGALRFPLRWFGIPQCWRYERTTRGRRREHYQWNMDVWGEADVSAEAELVAAIFALLDRLGLGRDEVKVRLSSRALLEETLRSGALRGREEAFPALCVIVDKLDKIGADAVVEGLSDPGGAVGLSRDSAREIVSWLGLRDLELAAGAAPAGSQGIRDLRRLFEWLDAYGCADRVVFDASIVRGLAYYTGIVFEAFDAGRSLRAICGGGRYDRLLSDLGGPPTPAVGFGFGDVVILELLEERGLLPPLGRALDAWVHPFGASERAAAVRLASRLREEGQRVELTLGDPKLRRVLADADKAGAKRVYMIGPEELERGQALVRDLASGEQSAFPIPD